MKLILDAGKLSFGDMEDFEAATGSELMASLGKIDADGDMSGIKAKDMVVLIWIFGRVDNPEFTIEDARKVRMADLEFTDAPVDPTEGSA